MSQKIVTVTDTPTAVAGTGIAQFQGLDTKVSYWVSAVAPDSSVPHFIVMPLEREPLDVPEGMQLWLAGSGRVTVFSETDPT